MNAYCTFSCIVKRDIDHGDSIPLWLDSESFETRSGKPRRQSQHYVKSEITFWRRRLIKTYETEMTPGWLKSGGLPALQIPWSPFQRQVKAGRHSASPRNRIRQTWSRKRRNWDHHVFIIKLAEGQDKISLTVQFGAGSARGLLWCLATADELCEVE